MNIKDIAKLAEVSVSTVSKIMNQKDQDISGETRKKVLEIAKEYNYTPYAKIRNSKPVKTGLIGVLVPQLEHDMAQLIQGASEEADREGYNLLLCSTEHNIEKAEKQIRMLAGKNVDGILLYTEKKLDRKLIRLLEEEKLVWLTAGSAKKMAGTDAVFYSREKAGFKAVQYLLELKHRSVGLLLTHSGEERGEAVKQGYLKALHEKRITVRPEFICFPAQPSREIRDAVAGLLATGVTAILCEDSEAAFYCCRELASRMLKVPEDISVMSAEDSQMLVLAEPPVSAMMMPVEAMGRIAVHKLIERMEKREEQIAAQILEPVFLDRLSCAMPSGKRGRKGDRILVAGSMNMDNFIRLPKAPSNGETVIAGSTSFIPGGKGANQAAGAGKLGGDVYMIGRLGDDDDGKAIYKSLVDSGVNTEGVMFEASGLTGKAYINVMPDGESSIVVYPGANRCFDGEQVERFSYLFEGAGYCLLSSEIQRPTVEQLISLCREKGVRVVVKPSPAEVLREDIVSGRILESIDFLIPNEKELNIICPGKESVEQKAEFLYEKGVKNVIVTLGKNGCYLKNEKHSRFFPAAEVVPVDTTGAADAFISAFAVYMSEGNDILRSIRFATCAAGFSVTREGVQPALPDRMMLKMYEEEIEQYER